METNLKHIALIMDGNRTWAKAKGLPKMIGHTEGAKNLRRIAKAASDKGIAYLTLWALSTENLKNRSESELKHLFSLAEKIINHLTDFEDNNVRFNLIGDITKLPESTQEALNHLVEKTSHHTGMTMTLAINYGGRDEIVRATKKMIDKGMSAKDITEESFEDCLDTADMPNVDLVIRTSDHQRLSGYLPWQTTYAELYFPKVKWPAFSEDDLENAITWFNEQKRNKGK
jgi:undecaprenyl diphosphate synthase